MRRNQSQADRLYAKQWLEIRRHKDPKTGDTLRGIGSPFFKALKEWMIVEEGEFDPWDQRVLAAIANFDEAHKPDVPTDPEQQRLIQPEAIWHLDIDKSLVIEEGEATRDHIRRRLTVIETTFRRQEAVFQTESRYLMESDRRSKTPTQKMKDIWRPDNQK